jgi:spore germination protein KB
VPHDETFGSWSLAAAASAMFLAVPLQPILAYTALRAGDTAAWATPLIAGTLALLLYLAAALMLGAFPGGSNLISLARAAGGEPAAIVTGLLVCGPLVFDCGLFIRRIAESAVTHLYPHTPQTFAMVALGLCVLYGAYGGLADLVRLGRLLLPLVVLAIAVILIGPLPWCDVRNLLPLWGPGVGPLLGGSVGLAGIYGPTVLFLLTAAGHLNDRRRLWRAGAVAMGGATMVFMAILAVILLAYPLPLGYSVTFPLQELTRLVTGGRFFERLESIWIVFEFSASAFYLAALLYTAAAAYAGAFRMATHRTAVLPLVTITLIASLIPTDQGEAILLRVATVPLSVTTAFILPLLLSLLAAWRGRVHGGEH